MQVLNDFQSQLYKSMQVSKDTFEVTLGRMLAEHEGHPSFYSDMLCLLGNIKTSNEKAQEYFMLVETHKSYLENTLGHTVDFRVALMDYFLHIQPKYKMPKIVEISDFESNVHLAAIDPLTKLFNRSVFTQYMQAEIARSSRHGYRFSIVFMDVDNFKNINDTFGHSFGDKALTAIASYIEQNLRSEDSAFRYGGEEFVMLLPHTDESGLRYFAQRLGTKVGFEPELFTNGLTFSAGSAVYPSDGITMDELLVVADKRMYQAKLEGKNKFVLPPSLQ